MSFSLWCFCFPGLCSDTFVLRYQYHRTTFYGCTVILVVLGIFFGGPILGVGTDIESRRDVRWVGVS